MKTNPVERQNNIVAPLVRWSDTHAPVEAQLSLLSPAMNREMRTMSSYRPQWISGPRRFLWYDSAPTPSSCACFHDAPYTHSWRLLCISAAEF
jgi:hypothetical protein